jgi:hypothetical protein
MADLDRRARRLRQDLPDLLIRSLTIVDLEVEYLTTNYWPFRIAFRVLHQ